MTKEMTKQDQEQAKQLLKELIGEVSKNSSVDIKVDANEMFRDGLVALGFRQRLFAPVHAMLYASCYFAGALTALGSLLIMGN